MNVVDGQSIGYQRLIQQFLYTYTQTPVQHEVRFESISASVLGTKQRRFGPMLPPEIQASVREILRQSGDHIKFFVPWGGRKQIDGDPVDILEYMALKQLACLQSELARFGITSSFQIRVEDITDFWLFEDDFDSNRQVEEYVDTFSKLGYKMLAPNSWIPIKESSIIDKDEFFKLARENQRLFHRFLTTGEGLEDLHARGWQSNIPQEQRDYYLHQYDIFYPEEDGQEKLAQYFASALTRVMLKGVAWPQEPFVFITFSHPIPGNLYAPNRLFYRTLPARHSNNHRSPWLAKGYLQIDEENNVCPKSLGYLDKADLIENTIDIDGVKIAADYILT